MPTRLKTWAISSRRTFRSRETRGVGDRGRERKRLQWVQHDTFWSLISGGGAALVKKADSGYLKQTQGAICDIILTNFRCRFLPDNLMGYR